LSPPQRRTAAWLARVLHALAQDLEHGRLTPAGAERRGRARLRRVRGIDLDYLAVRDPRTLAVPGPRAREFVVLVAARIGSVHLIDNVRARLIGRA
jgi:pantoate--beta-alanine ligase